MGEYSVFAGENNSSWCHVSLLLEFCSLSSNGFFDGTETVWRTGLEAGDLEQNTWYSRPHYSPLLNWEHQRRWFLRVLSVPAIHDFKIQNCAHWSPLRIINGYRIKYKLTKGPCIQNKLMNSKGKKQSCEKN